LLQDELFLGPFGLANVPVLPIDSGELINGVDGIICEEIGPELVD